MAYVFFYSSAHVIPQKLKLIYENGFHCQRFRKLWNIFLCVKYHFVVSRIYSLCTESTFYCKTEIHKCGKSVVLFPLTKSHEYIKINNLYETVKIFIKISFNYQCHENECFIIWATVFLDRIPIISSCDS